MFQYPLVIALGDAPHFGQLLRTAETAQPPPVVENRPDGLRTDTADRTQRRRVGRIQLHRIVQRTPPFGEEGVLGQTPARRIADNRIVAQLLLVAETADEGVVVGDRLGLPLRETEGKVCSEFVMCYPPGIPILAPGERITAEILDYIEYAKAKGCNMTGPEDPDILRLNVLTGRE